MVPLLTSDKILLIRTLGLEKGREDKRVLMERLLLLLLLLLILFPNVLLGFVGPTKGGVIPTEVIESLRRCREIPFPLSARLAGE